MARLADGIATLIPRQGRDAVFSASLTGLIFAMLIALLWSPQAGAQIAAPIAHDRVALVIGNSSYRNVPALPNPANDAFAMSDSLRRLGFAVQEGIDLDAAGMATTLRSFGAMAANAEVALVFYAGHGIQVDGQNFLLPVDAALRRERDLNYEAVPLDLILSEASQASKLALVILDACRDNPFAGQLQESMGPTRSTSVGRGLGRVDAPADTLVAFATRDGAVAEDGTGFNSPFTTALLTHLNEPGVEIGHYFRKVRDTVISSTNGRQEPFVYGSLSAEQFYLNPASASTQVAAAPAQPAVQPSIQPAQPSGQADLEADMLFWRSIQDSTDAAEYFAYLSRFPNGVFADLARNRLVTISTPVTDQTDRGTQEVAAATGNFGAIAMSVANWRRLGVCVDMADQQAANNCAIAKCGHNYCQVHVEFGAGQCAAVVAGNFATAASQSDAMEGAKRACWSDRGRQSEDCRRRVVADCNS